MTSPSSQNLDLTGPNDTLVAAVGVANQKISKDPLDTTRLDAIFFPQQPAHLAASEIKSSGGPISRSYPWRTVGIRLALAVPVTAGLIVIFTKSPPLGLKIGPRVAMERMLGLDRTKVRPDRLDNDGTGSTALKSSAAPTASPAGRRHDSGVYDGIGTHVAAFGRPPPLNYASYSTRQIVPKNAHFTAIICDSICCDLPPYQMLCRRNLSGGAVGCRGPGSSQHARTA